MFGSRRTQLKRQAKSNSRSRQSLGIVLVMFFAMAFSCRDGIRKGTTDFTPYKGKLNELLKTELSSGLIKFKLVATTDVAGSYTGATEAKGFTYMQEGGGVSVKVDGALVNYPSASQADTRLAEFARKSNGTLEKKNGGQRLTTPDGKTVAWTNGSLLCIVTSGFAKPATNFESSAPF